MRRSTLRLLCTLALTLGLVPATAASGSADPAVATHSDNIQHVRNIPYESVRGHTENFGTDVEFDTLTVSREAVRNLPVPDGQRRPTDADSSKPGVQREFAFAGSYQNGLQIVDITDPASSYEAAVYDCGVLQGDVQVFDQDGRTYVTYTSEDTSSIDVASRCVQELAPEATATNKKPAYGTYVVDVTDPFDPQSQALISVPEGSHNGTVHPSGNFFYNSNSSLYHNTVEDGGPGIEIYDISNIETKAPQRLLRLPLPIVPLSLGTESHDITFNAAGDRAYSAALSQGVIIDTTNPAQPSIVSSFVDPSINVWHQSDPVTLTADDGTQRDFLLVEDEVAGALPTGQCPNGGVHIYEITGALENSPAKVGYWNIDEVRTTDGVGTCTAHVFDIHQDAGIMTIAYYNGGVRVVDLNGLVGVGLGDTALTGDPMTQLAFYRFDNSDTWSAKTPRIEADGSFYLYGNDIERGLDVYHYEGTPSAEAAAQGRWMTPAEAQAMADERPDLTLEERRPLCVLPSLD